MMAFSVTFLQSSHYYADAKGNADGNAKQTAGTESIHRCPYWAAK